MFFCTFHGFGGWGETGAANNSIFNSYVASMLTLRCLSSPLLRSSECFVFPLCPVCLLDSGAPSFPLSGHLKSHHSPTLLQGLRAPHFLRNILGFCAFSHISERSAGEGRGWGESHRTCEPFVHVGTTTSSEGGGVSKMKTCGTSALASSFNL